MCFPCGFNGVKNKEKDNKEFTKDTENFKIEQNHREEEVNAYEKLWKKWHGFRCFKSLLQHTPGLCGSSAG